MDGADRCDLKIEANLLHKLSHEEVLEMVLKENAVAKRVKRGILKTKYDLYHGCRAIMYIFTNRQSSKIIKE